MIVSDHTSVVYGDEVDDNNAFVKSELRGKAFQVLDKGFVMLTDVMGSDHDICEAARTSYGTGTKKISGDRDLLRYMFRHKHSTPFEMAELKFLIQMPMDCHRQQVRHRTASISEYSTRYSEAIDDTQCTDPNQWRLQSTTNKQGSGGFVTEWPGSDEGTPPKSIKSKETPGEYLSKIEHYLHDHAKAVYQERLNLGVAKEQARKDLPLSTYTRYFWKIDLGNLLHYLGLRMEAHAQHEIRQYANVIGQNIVAKLFPLTWEAFLDYKFNAITLSKLEVEAIRDCLGLLKFYKALQIPSTNKRECEEFTTKQKLLGIIGRNE